MLPSLAQWLQTLSPEFGFFRVFQYLTFRAVMAALTALLIGLIAATALWSGVQALNQQARTAYDRAAATFGGARTGLGGSAGATTRLVLSVP